MNPYEELGVEKSATTDEIRAAWRRLARDVHPDKYPGDPEKKAAFQRLQASYEILADPDRRKKFDDTGSVDDGPSVEARAREAVYAAAMSVLDVCQEHEHLSINVVSAMRNFLSKQKSEFDHEIRRGEKYLRRFERLRKDVSGAALENILDQKISDCRRHSAVMKGNVEVVTCAIDLLKDYKHDVAAWPENNSEQPTLVIKGLLSKRSFKDVL